MMAHNEHPPLPDIRPLYRADAPLLHAGLWADMTVAAVRARVERLCRAAETKRGQAFVVSVGTRIVGYGQILRLTTCAEISDLLIAGAYRGRGLGTRLIERCIAHMRARVTCIEIGAAVDNTRALALYRRLGFVDDHTRTLNLGDGLVRVQYLRWQADDPQSFTDSPAE